MLIRIKQIRRLADGKAYGTDVPLGTGKKQRTLEFRPLDPQRPEHDHVCNVTDKDDIATLLAIPSGFEIHESQVGTTEAKLAQAASTAPDLSRVSDAELEAELERRGLSRARSSADTKPELPADKDAGDPPPAPPADMTRAELVAAVAKKTGKKPNPSTSVKKLKEMLAE